MCSGNVHVWFICHVKMQLKQWSKKQKALLSVSHAHTRHLNAFTFLGSFSVVVPKLFFYVVFVMSHTCACLFVDSWCYNIFISDVIYIISSLYAAASIKCGNYELCILTFLYSFQLFSAHSAHCFAKIVNNDIKISSRDTRKVIVTNHSKTVVCITCCTIYKNIKLQFNGINSITAKMSLRAER